ncbi:Stk1 family PASTA domain-containing Ser/Thr kinase [Clostridium aestuarii]|uniref:non-specific serine/threonine protein kinase n=1 Tax=Clostridium aestuarii TaxID=338193 RepID=A0ABT4D1S5_9CLOT|nr:Stk1 family PASTA domain-containing Ser/Thr kinase [Clostridium aestuarii]MCY6483998.1 Stk1 family PASTA domain-containing Ser/Thr kinase [Clostridium aestuarii]
MTGTILGNRYELLDKIGEGGMAEVYKAKCHLLNRYVAVKILKSQYLDNIEFVNKFKQEAASAAPLSHNNIVSIYDIGSEENINYIVMEYIDGKTLKQVINQQKILNYKDAIIIAIQIARALECAHNNNIIHRDIKPHNIMVTKEGIIKVTDFGIAKATTSFTITNSERIIGSAHYFSPEQAKGSYVNCKTDIYSLGIILYEMVTGKLPYDAETPVSIALKHIQEAAVPPIQINPSIPQNLNKVILKAIEKEQYKRYDSAQDILLDLQKIKKDPECEILSYNEEKEYTKIMKPIVNLKNDKNENIEEFEDDDEEYHTNGKVKKILIGVLAAVFIAVIGFTAAYVISKRKLEPPKVESKIFKVPNIIGKSKEEAQKIVEAKGLKFVVTMESSDKPKDEVIQCYPYEGTEIDTSEKDEIRAIVSSGPKVSTIPNLVEIEFQAAKEYLKIYDLKLGSVSYKYNDNVEKGYVCNQSPKPDAEIGNNTFIDLVISKGSEIKYTEVPNLVNKNFDEVQEILTNLKLKLGKVTKIDTIDESMDGIVSIQSINKGKEVKENTLIDISYYVYNNDVAVIVPNFTNKTISEAKKIAKEYNLVLEVEGEDDFVIISQDKAPGREVTEKSIIKLKSEPNP